MAARPGASLTRYASKCLAARDSRVPRTFTRTLATETTPTTPFTIDTSSTSQPQHASNTLTRDASDTLDTSQPTLTTSARAVLHPFQHQPPPNPFLIPAQCTLYSFPQLEPTGKLATYPSTHLMLPLRKDLLHLAVTFEADATRQGTASTKWRNDVHGSGRKIRPQKGSGRARLGDKKSPMLRGGGVAFGPKPRDFSTDLPRKMYDLAWRTALSYRYRRGQLFVVDGVADVKDIHQDSRARYLKDMFVWHKMGHGCGRTMIITNERRPAMASAFENEMLLRHGELVERKDVDVKDLLELGRIIIERAALEKILCEHQSDLGAERQLRALRSDLKSRQPSDLSISSSAISS